MADGDFVIANIAGGSLNQIDLIKKINYPENLVPEVNMPGTKGFRINVLSTDLIKEVEWECPKDIYLAEVSVTCEEYDDEDYWELEAGEDKICETMYTLEPPSNSSSGNGFQIFPKILEGTIVKFSFTNGSGKAKKVWMTLGYMYNKNT